MGVHPAKINSYCSLLIELTISLSGEVIWPVAVVSPAGGSKVSDSASVRVLPGLFPNI